MEKFTWPSNSPKDAPFKPSEQIKGIVFTGIHVEYTNADTWYPSWASDGNMYSPWTDGWVGENHCCSRGIEFELDSIKNRIKRGDADNSALKSVNLLYDSKKFPATGNAKIVGDDPMDLQIVNLGIRNALADPYGARYPCGSLVHNGIWYYGTYCLDTSDITSPALAWDIMGPFVGFRISKDFGKTWIETSHTPEKPLFKESGKKGAKVKIGAPHFVDFGKDMVHSPDSKAYIVAHGAVRSDANLGWIIGDQIYLIRVTPSIDNINDMSEYEFFAGNNEKGEPIWAREFKNIKPLIEWNDRCGCVTMTYDAPLEKYLMCVADVYPQNGPYNTYILEADKINGPWKLVVFMEKFGGQGYFVNIPSKFISNDGKSAWLCYSANWTGSLEPIKWEVKPVGSRYGSLVFGSSEWIRMQWLLYQSR